MAAGPYSLLLNARVSTGDPASPFAAAVLVSGDRIVAVGGAADLRELSGPGATVIDCQGGALLPGLHDAHIHLLATASRLSAVDCAASRSLADIQEVLRGRARQLPARAWVRAVGYDETALVERRHPTRWDLDAAVPHRPVRLQHRSYHACVLNSAALQIAGIGPEMEEPAGGVIERDLESGEPTGLLYETAQDLVRRVMPPLSQAEVEDGVMSVSRELLSWGVTALQDATESNVVADVHLFSGLQEKGLLRQRAVVMGRFDLAGQPGDGPRAARLHLGAVKIVLDESTGRLYPDPDDVRERVVRAHRAGLQVAIHAVTREAVDAGLNAIEHAQGLHPRAGLRHRIEHCSVCTPEAARRIASLGVLVCTQPGFVHESGDRYLSEVAPDQIPCLYPLRSLLDAGVTLAGGSDSPIAVLNPLVAIHGAVTRRSRSGHRVGSEQAIPLRSAVAMYTEGAAAACLQEQHLGRIAPGYLADLVLFAQDPFALPPDALLEVRASLTLVGGEIVWDGRR